MPVLKSPKDHAGLLSSPARRNGKPDEHHAACPICGATVDLYYFAGVMTVRTRCPHYAHAEDHGYHGLSCWFKEAR